MRFIMFVRQSFMGIGVFLVLTAAMAAAAVQERDTPRFAHWGVEEGMSQVSGNCIAQDPTGFLWIGTQAGLNRFDGYDFRVFNYDPHQQGTLSDGWIESLLVDSAGRLWIGTHSGGLDRLADDGRHFIPFSHVDDDTGSLSHNAVLALAEDVRGRIWVGTAEGGLNLLLPDGRHFRHFRFDPSRSESLISDSVTALLADTDGSLWVGTDKGLDRLDSALSAFDHWDLGESSERLGVQALYCDKEGRLWVGTAKGLFVKKPQADRFSRYDIPSGDPGETGPIDITAIREDGEGWIWLASRGDGIRVLNPQNDRILQCRRDPTRPLTLSGNVVLSLFTDRAGTVWVGTYEGGLNAYSPARFKFATYRHDPFDANSLANNGVRALCLDHRGILWIGTDGGGLDAFDRRRRTFAHYRTHAADPGSLPYDFVRSVIEDDTGRIWVGTNGGGIGRLDTDRRRFVTFRHDPANLASLSDDRILGLYQDRNGLIWVATAGGGLDCLDPREDHFLHYRHDPQNPYSLSSDIVRVVYEDRSGILWVGTRDGGLNRFDRDTGVFTHFRHDPLNSHSLSNDRITCLHEDQTGKLWVGTWGGGLNRLDRKTGQFSRFLEADGCPSNAVSGILEDDTGDLWISSTRGIARFTPREGTFRYYDARDGLQGNGFNGGAFFQADDGEMFFGGTDGFNSFYPQHIPFNSRVPEVVITTLSIFGRPLNPPRPIWSTREIELSYRQNFISLEFAALDFINPTENRYAYKLEGVDRDWVECGTRRTAQYTNLEGGRYVFRVRGANSDGVWNEDGASLTLVIVPPVWKTGWFRWVMILLGGGLMLGAYHWRIRRITALNRRLEEQVAHRTFEIKEKQDQLERIDRIIQAVNREWDIDSLLTSLLDNIRLIRGVERASFLLPADDGDGYVLRPAWYSEDGTGLLSGEDVQRLFLTGLEEISPDILVGDRPAETIAARAVVRIRVQQDVAGYLILDNLSREGAFGSQGVPVLGQLRGHLVSAFGKARMLADLRRKNELILQQVEELRRANEKKNEFLGIAVHDLRTPLNGITGLLDLMLREMESGSFSMNEWVGDMKRLLDSAEHMASLINELLDISAIESGKVDLRLDRQDMGEILEESWRFHRRLAHRKNIRLTMSKPADLPPVRVDRLRLMDVVNNLLSNALKYTFPGGEVRIWCEIDGDEVVTRVQDTGQGLDGDDLSRIFNSFTRLSARLTAGEPSTGLGLAIVRKIVELHGGRVWVESEKGTGSTFSFSLPASARDVSPSTLLH